MRSGSDFRRAAGFIPHSLAPTRRACPIGIYTQPRGAWPPSFQPRQGPEGEWSVATVFVTEYRRASFDS